MHQHQYVYDIEVKEYLDEALHAGMQHHEYQGMSVVELHRDVIEYLSAKHDAPWYRFSGRKVAQSLTKYHTLVTELLSA